MDVLFEQSEVLQHLYELTKNDKIINNELAEYNISPEMWINVTENNYKDIKNDNLFIIVKALHKYRIIEKYNECCKEIVARIMRLEFGYKYPINNYLCNDIINDLINIEPNYTGILSYIFGLPIVLSINDFIFSESLFGHGIAKKYNGNLDTDKVVKYGNLALIKKILVTNYFKTKNDLIFSALMNGDLKIAKYLYYNFDVKICSINQIIKNGHLHICKWLYKEKILTLKFLKECEIIFMCGHLHIIKWLHSLNCGFPFHAYRIAAMHKHTHIIEWARDIGLLEQNLNEICQAAIYNGELDYALWALQNYGKPDKITMNTIINCNIEFAKWLVENRICVRHIMPDYIICNKIDILKYIIDNYNYDAHDYLAWFNIALRYNKLDSAILLYKMLDINLKPRLNIFGTLCSVGIDNIINIYGIENGHECVDLLEWYLTIVTENLPKIYEQIYLRAASNENIYILEWCSRKKLIQNFSEEINFNAVERILRDHNWELGLQWIINNNLTKKHDFYKIFIEKEDLNLIKWAHYNNLPKSKKLCEYALYAGNFEIIKWILLNDFPYDKNLLSIKYKNKYDHKLKNKLINFILKKNFPLYV